MNHGGTAAVSENFTCREPDGGAAPTLSKAWQISNLQPIPSVLGKIGLASPFENRGSRQIRESRMFHEVCRNESRTISKAFLKTNA
ncbi:hypothetical protein ACWJKU_18515 [Methylocaldum sp. MU1018]